MDPESEGAVNTHGDKEGGVVSALGPGQAQEDHRGVL